MNSKAWDTEMTLRTDGSIGGAISANICCGVFCCCLTDAVPIEEPAIAKGGEKQFTSLTFEDEN